MSRVRFDSVFGRTAAPRLANVALLAGAVGSGVVLYGFLTSDSQPRELTPAEYAKIADVVRRETSSPVRSTILNADGTVRVQVGGSDEPGGQIFQLGKSGGEWRTLSRMLLF